MNGVELVQMIANICTLIFLVASLRSRRYWIDACQKQMTKRWQERLPVDTAQITRVLEEHRIRWVNVPDPGRDERMPDIGNHLPECPTCGPVPGITDASAHPARVLAIQLNKGQLRTASEGFLESTQPPATDVPSVTARVHRLEVEIAGGRPHGLFNGDITFKGVCDAGEGAACRMWCNDPDCREEAGEDHDSHLLVDQGECGVIGTLNADPSMIPEIYEGPTGPLRSGFIELTQDIDGVTWRYVEDSVADLQRLVEYGRGLIAYSGSLVQYGEHLAEYHGSLNALAEFLVGGPLAGSPEPPPGLGLGNTPAPSYPDCAESCHHRCPECRLGLGTHLTCDPLCHHHVPAPSQ